MSPTDYDHLHIYLGAWRKTSPHPSNDFDTEFLKGDRAFGGGANLPIFAVCNQGYPCTRFRFSILSTS